MKKYKYVAYDADNGEYDTFESFEDASEWLVACGTINGSEGFGMWACEGESYIAKITHRTHYEITDKAKNYHEHTDKCPDGCDEEEWPYGSEFDTVGNLILKEV